MFIRYLKKEMYADILTAGELIKQARLRRDVVIAGTVLRVMHSYEREIEA